MTKPKYASMSGDTATDIGAKSRNELKTTPKTTK